MIVYFLKDRTIDA